MLKKPYRSITAIKEELEAEEEAKINEAFRKLQALINYTLVHGNITSKKSSDIFTLVLSLYDEDLTDEEIINKINATYNSTFSKRRRKKIGG